MAGLYMLSNIRILYTPGNILLQHKLINICWYVHILCGYMFKVLPHVLLVLLVFLGVSLPHNYIRCVSSYHHQHHQSTLNLEIATQDIGETSRAFTSPPPTQAKEHMTRPPPTQANPHKCRRGGSCTNRDFEFHCDLPDLWLDPGRKFSHEI